MMKRFISLMDMMPYMVEESYYLKQDLEQYLVGLAMKNSPKYAKHMAYLKKRLVWDDWCEEIILNALNKATRMQNAAQRIQRQWRACISDPSYMVCKQRLLREAEEMIA